MENNIHVIIYKVRLDVSVTDSIYESKVDTVCSSRHNLEAKSPALTQEYAAQQLLKAYWQEESKLYSLIINIFLSDFYRFPWGIYGTLTK